MWSQERAVLGGFLILGKEDRVGSQTWRGKRRDGVVRKE